MTRFIYDQFAKDYLEELLTPLGKVESSRRVAGEVREIDVWFEPINTTAGISPLRLLAKLTTTPAIFEPYRNPVTSNQICDCLLKLLEIKSYLQREANRQKTTITEDGNPKLWILTPTASQELLSRFRAIEEETDWEKGIYFLAMDLRTAIIVIHQLPVTPSTLWLRILGKGRVQKNAIDELIALPKENPFREKTLKLLYGLQKNLEVTQPQEQEDRELIMRLSPLYQQDREEAIQQGIQQGLQQGLQQGKRQVIENLLRVRFGELDDQLAAVIEPMLAMPPEEFTTLLLQLDQEAIIARFS